MRGITPRREQGMADPVLTEMVHGMGLDEAPHYAAVKPKIQAYRRRWGDLAPYRDGPVNVTRVAVDPAEITRAIKDKARDLGADMFYSRAEAEKIVAQLRAIPERDIYRHEIIAAGQSVLTSIKDRK